MIQYIAIRYWKKWLVFHLDKMMMIYTLLLILLFMKVNGSTGNITQFDDGSDDFNITSNTTKYITIPANSTVSSAVLSSRGNFSFNYTDANDFENIDGGDTVFGISLIPDTTQFLVTGTNDEIYRLNSSGGKINSFTINDSSGIGFTFSSYFNHDYYGIHAINNDTFFVIGFEPSTDSNDNRYILKGNYSRCLVNNSCISDVVNITKWTGTVGLYVDSSEEYAYVTVTNDFGKGIIQTRDQGVIKINVTNCGINNCLDTDGLDNPDNYSIDYVDDISSDGNTFYVINKTTNELLKFDSSFTLLDEYTIQVNSTLDGKEMTDFNGLSMNDTMFYIVDWTSTDEVAKFEFRFPQDVIWKINGTEIFNQPGVLDTNNASVNLSNTLIQDMLISGSLIDFVVTSSDWYGYESFYDLEIIYDTSNAAVLSIVTPAQITASVFSSDSYTETDINITNTGDYNATSLSFVTVSGGGTPNYNDSISFSCSDVLIDINNSVLCNVTFSSLIQNPEPDEKLKLRSIGTDLGALVYSDSIDVDITITTTQGGGGGGAIGISRCNWRVWTPRNQIMSLIGSYGYKSNWKTIQIYNNETFSTFFTFNQQGLDCKFEESSITVEGSSFGNNRVQCIFPPEEDTGQIIITGGGCTSSINVGLKSNMLGLIFTYIGGGAGMAQAFLVWAGLIIVIGGLIKVFS